MVACGWSRRFLGSDDIRTPRLGGAYRDIIHWARVECGDNLRHSRADYGASFESFGYSQKILDDDQEDVGRIADRLSWFSTRWLDRIGLRSAFGRGSCGRRVE